MTTGPSLWILPAELRSIVFNSMIDGGQADELSDLLCTCSEIYDEVQHALSKRRHNMTHVVNASYWRQVSIPSRDLILSKAVAVKERKNVKSVKFIGSDDNILFHLWRPDRALDNFKHHQIQPTKVILQYAYSTPNLAGAGIGALTDAIDDITRLVSSIERITVCNVPQKLLFFLGCQVLNIQYMPNMDINAMSDGLLAQLSLNNSEWFELTLDSPVQPGGLAVRDVTVHVTMLNG